MEIKQDPNTVFSRPRNGLCEVCPRELWQERLVKLSLDSPVTKGDSNEIKTRSSDIGKVLLGDERPVVLVHDRREIRFANRLCESILVDGLRGTRLVSLI